MQISNRLATIILALLVAGASVFVIAVTWMADEQAIERLGDFVAYLDDHRDNQAKVIITLAALAPILIASMVIMLELMPTHLPDIRVIQAGGVTVVLSARSIGETLAEEVRSMPEVRDATVEVRGRKNGVSVIVDLLAGANVHPSTLADAVGRLVQEAAQRRIGVSIVLPPVVRIRLASGDDTSGATPYAVEERDSSSDSSESDS